LRILSEALREGCGRHGKRVKLTKFTLGVETRELCSVWVSAAARDLRARVEPSPAAQRRAELATVIANRPGR
jgi:hypothetical protein